MKELDSNAQEVSLRQETLEEPSFSRVLNARGRDRDNFDSKTKGRRVTHAEQRMQLILSEGLSRNYSSMVFSFSGKRGKDFLCTKEEERETPSDSIALSKETEGKINCRDSLRLLFSHKTGKDA